MKVIIFLACLIGLVYSRPQPQVGAAAARIVESAFDNIGLGNYYYLVKTSDGLTREEKGVLTDAGTENERIEVEGSYFYVDKDGEEHNVFYTSGKDGFKPRGDHFVPSADVETIDAPVQLPSAALASLAG